MSDQKPYLGAILLCRYKGRLMLLSCGLTGRWILYSCELHISYSVKKSSNSVKPHSIHFGTEDNMQGSLRIHLGSSFSIMLVANLCSLFNTRYSGTMINNVRKSMNLPHIKFSVFFSSDVLLRFGLCRLTPYQKWMPCCSYNCTSNGFAVAVCCFPLKVVHTSTKTFPEISIFPHLPFLTE